MGTVLGIVGLVVLIVVLVTACVLFTWKKVPADKAAIITGIGHAKVVTGGGTVVIPVLQRIDYITLENINFEVAMRGSLTSDAVPIEVNGVVVVKVRNEDSMIRAAVEQFNCGKPDETLEHIRDTARDVCEGRLREIVAGMTAEGIYKDRKTFSEQVQEVAAKQLSELGLELKSFTIKGISDQNGYFDALSKPRIAAVKRDAQIAEAEARKESMVKTSESDRAGEQARLEAEARKAEAAKEAEVKKLDYQKEIETRKAVTDAAYDIQANITKKEVTNAEMDASVLKEQRAKEVREAQIAIDIAAEQKNIELAQKRAERKERELLELVIKPAEADKRAQELAAEAAKITSIREAEAEAEAKKLDAIAEAERIKQAGIAQAEVVRQTGLAEAEAIRQKGMAEAEAMEKRAEAYAKYGQAAITEMVIDKLPEIARAIAEPMGKIGNITIIGGGGEDGGSATDVARMTLGTLKAVTEGMKDTLGFDPVEVMRANTFEGKTSKDITLNLKGLPEAVAEVATHALEEAAEKDDTPINPA